MQAKATYEFAIIRVVPQVEREEFINVGVIVYSKSKNFLGIKYKIDKKRLLSLNPDIDLDLIQKYLAAWKAICEGGKEGGEIGQMEKSYRFRWLASNRSTILQTSKVHPGLCQDSEKVMVDLFDKYVFI
jgi:hypothetical protein